MRRFRLAAMGGSAATAFLVSENFEGTGAPAGWINGVGTPNYDYTATVLEGAQSLFVNTNGVATTAIVDFANQSEFWTYFMAQFVGSAPGSALAIGAFRPNGGGAPSIAFTLSGTLRLAFSTASPSAAITLGTTYHVWLHYKAGTGANAILDLGYSTTGVRPTSGTTFGSTGGGAQTASLGRIELGINGTTQTVDCIYDKLRISTVQIGDNGS